MQTWTWQQPRIVDLVDEELLLGLGITTGHDGRAARRHGFIRHGATGSSDRHGGRTPARQAGRAHSGGWAQPHHVLPHASTMTQRQAEGHWYWPDK